MQFAPVAAPSRHRKQARYGIHVRRDLPRRHVASIIGIKKGLTTLRPLSRTLIGAGHRLNAANTRTEAARTDAVRSSLSVKTHRESPVPADNSKLGIAISSLPLLVDVTVKPSRVQPTSAIICAATLH